MMAFRQKRLWFWVAIAAIVIALAAFLVPHIGDTPNQPAWLVMLPVFFIGLQAPLSLLGLLFVLSLGHPPETPALTPSFQRPPPDRT